MKAKSAPKLVHLMPTILVTDASEDLVMSVTSRCKDNKCKARGTARSLSRRVQGWLVETPFPALKHTEVKTVLAMQLDLSTNSLKKRTVHMELERQRRPQDAYTKKLKTLAEAAQVLQEETGEPKHRHIHMSRNVQAPVCQRSQIPRSLELEYPRNSP